MASGWLAFAFEIAHLAADHAAHGARGGGEFRDQRDSAVGRAVHLRQHLEGEREQRVAGQNRHGVAEDFVAGGVAAAQIVVIERGQIVVNQRIGVDQLERAGRGFDADRRIRHSFGGGHAQDRADALAAREQAVAHGAVDGFGRRGLGRDPALQRGVHARLLAREVFGERHAFSGRNGSAWILSPLRISISTRVSASSSCLRQVSLSCIPFSNSSSARSSGSSPLSISLTISSSCWSPVSKLAAGFFFGHFLILAFTRV